MSGAQTRLVDVETLRLLFHTASNMEPGQLVGVADRKVRHSVVPRLPVDFDARYERRVPDGLSCTPGPIRANTTVLRRCLCADDRAALRSHAAEAAAGEVEFLNRTVRVETADGVDWHGDGVYDPPALWALKFHGFEFLQYAYLGDDDPTDCPDAVDAYERWLREWRDDEGTDIGTEAYLRRAWTPHSVSFRLLNGTRYYAWLRPEERNPELAETLYHILYRNACFLANHVEHDVGGNHLIENGVALVLAGLFFGDAGNRWVEQGLRVLVDAEDQFLSDGGHFELSPMYHVQTLQRYLTALDLLRRFDRTPPVEVQRVAERGTRFLRAIKPPDGRLPLLNDAVYGESLSLSAVLRYADAVGVDPGPSAATTMTDSGYYWLGDGDDRLLVDGAGVGPPHLPAHSHNDHLSILLWVDDRPVLTDTGTYEYAPTERRQHARSVAAHNTVQYGDVEPIDIAGSYLMGRRLAPTVRYAVENGVTVFDGSYRRAGRDSYRHRRRIYAADDWWFVWDDVTAAESRPVRSRLHVDPSVSVDAPTAGEGTTFGFRADDRTDPLAYLCPVGAETATVGTSPYYPSFLTEVTRPLVTLRSAGADVSFGFLLSKQPYDISATPSSDSPTLSLDGREYQLPSLR